MSRLQITAGDKRPQVAVGCAPQTIATVLSEPTVSNNKFRDRATCARVHTSAQKQADLISDKTGISMTTSNIEGVSGLAEKRIHESAFTHTEMPTQELQAFCVSTEAPHYAPQFSNLEENPNMLVWDFSEVNERLVDRSKEDLSPNEYQDISDQSLFAPIFDAKYMTRAGEQKTIYPDSVDVTVLDNVVGMKVRWTNNVDDTVNMAIACGRVTGFTLIGQPIIYVDGYNIKVQVKRNAEAETMKHIMNQSHTRRATMSELNDYFILSEVDKVGAKKTVVGLFKFRFEPVFMKTTTRKLVADVGVYSPIPDIGHCTSFSLTVSMPTMAEIICPTSDVGQWDSSQQERNVFWLDPESFNDVPKPNIDYQENHSTKKVETYIKAYKVQLPVTPINGMLFKWRLTKRSDDIHDAAALSIMLSSLNTNESDGAKAECICQYAIETLNTNLYTIKISTPISPNGFLQIGDADRHEKKTFRLLIVGDQSYSMNMKSSPVGMTNKDKMNTQITTLLEQTPTLFDDLSKAGNISTDDIVLASAIKFDSTARLMMVDGSPTFNARDIEECSKAAKAFESDGTMGGTLFTSWSEKARTVVKEYEHVILLVVTDGQLWDRDEFPTSYKELQMRSASFSGFCVGIGAWQHEPSLKMVGIDDYCLLEQVDEQLTSIAKRYIERAVVRNAETFTLSLDGHTNQIVSSSDPLTIYKSTINTFGARLDQTFTITVAQADLGQSDDNLLFRFASNKRKRSEPIVVNVKRGATQATPFQALRWLDPLFNNVAIYFVKETLAQIYVENIGMTCQMATSFTKVLVSQDIDIKPIGKGNPTVAIRPWDLSTIQSLAPPFLDPYIYNNDWCRDVQDPIYRSAQSQLAEEEPVYTSLAADAAEEEPVYTSLAADAGDPQTSHTTSRPVQSNGLRGIEWMRQLKVKNSYIFNLNKDVLDTLNKMMSYIELLKTDMSTKEKSEPMNEGESEPMNEGESEPMNEGWSHPYMNRYMGLSSLSYLESLSKCTRRLNKVSDDVLLAQYKNTLTYIGYKLMMIPSEMASIAAIKLLPNNQNQLFETLEEAALSVFNIATSQLEKDVDSQERKRQMQDRENALKHFDGLHSQGPHGLK